MWAILEAPARVGEVAFLGSIPPETTWQELSLISALLVHIGQTDNLD